MLGEDAVEHGEDGLLLGLGETRGTLELALELGRRAPLAGVGAGNAEEHIGGHGEERERVCAARIYLVPVRAHNPRVMRTRP